MSQARSVPPPSKTAAAVAFVASAIVALLVTFSLVSSFIRLFKPAIVETPERIGRIAGELSANALIALVGYGIAVALYSIGMAKLYPATDSPIGRLQQLNDATKNVNVTDFSSDGFYANATDLELLRFYPKLQATPDSPRFAALVLEVRRRLQEP